MGESQDVEISVEASGGVAIARISGEADADNCHEIGGALLDAPAVTGANKLNLDLGQLSFIDSSAISELLRIRSELVESGTEVTITETSEVVHRVLDITGLLEVFGISA